MFHRALDLDPTQAPDLLDIDTARYSLAPGVMAFGIRTGSQHQGVASYSDSRLGLYVIDGRDIRQVLDLSVSSSFQMSDSCDEWRDTRRTVAIGDRPAGGGFADLVVTETSSSAKPDKRNESGCEFVASKERSRWVLHYDGRTYPPPPKER